MQVNSFLVHTPNVKYSVPNFCASNPIKKDSTISEFSDNTGAISRAEVEINKKAKEEQAVNKLLKSITENAKTRKISNSYLTDIINACKNEDETLNKDALHLANHFMKSGMSMTRKDNILGTIEFCKDKNGFSKQMGSIIETYIDNRMKPYYNYCSNKFSEHLNNGNYFNSVNPIKNEDGVFDKDCLAYLDKYSKIGLFDDITCAASTLSHVNPLLKCEDDNKQTLEFKKLIFNNEKFMGADELIQYILNLVKYCDAPESAVVPRVLKQVIKDDNWTPNMIETLMSNCVEQKAEENPVVYVQMFQRYDDLLKDKMLPAGPINNFVKYSGTFTPENINEWYKTEDAQKIIKDVEAVKQRMLENPSLYINELIEGYSMSDTFNKMMINDFFGEGYNYQTLIHFVGIFDKKTLDVLMRKRLDDVQEFIDMYAKMSEEEENILFTLANCKDTDGNEFTPQEKLHFIDLVNTYKHNRISTRYITNFIDSDNNIFDIDNANVYLIERVLKKCGLSDDEIEAIPQEKIDKLDTKNIHLFIESLKEDKSGAGKTLLKVMLTDDFNKYIQNKNNPYGLANSLTRNEFEAMGINYDNWINTDKELEVILKSGHVNGQTVDNIAEQLYEDIESIRKSPAGAFFDKQFKQYIKDGEFEIPKNISSNEKNLTKFINEILTRLEPVKSRAQRTLELNGISEVAQNTLTYLNHIEQRAKDIDSLSMIPTDKKLDVTVKMWDRDPLKDIYQGNYSTCCLAMGNNTNGEAIFNYLLNTAFNMIEIVDNKSNKTIGNALCYFTKDENNKPAFIIDNIEISNKHKLSDDSSILLRDKIKEYAQNVVESVSNEDIPIYLGTNYNDVSTDDLNTVQKQMKFAGKITNKNTYLDIYDGWINTNKLDKTVELLEL